MPLWQMIILAFILDLFWGDPVWLPHPVRAIGWLISLFERFLRQVVPHKKTAGALLACLVIGITWGSVAFFIRILTDIHSVLGACVAVFFIYTSLAVKDLGVEAMRVYHALDKEDLDDARKNVALIVGRDTERMTREEIIRASVETVAENIVDGIVSPLFYACIGGAPLALAYKAVNTLDSMVGYKNDEYKDLGFVSARLDDIANFIPARITALIVPLAALLAGKDFAHAWQVIARDRRKHPSPNSGIPEAAVAGALRIQIGGINYYQGKPSLKPFIGDDMESLTIGHITDSIKISRLSAVLILILGIIVLMHL